MPEHEKKKRETGEMRRRHEALLRSGVMSRLGSEARMVLTYALCYADYRRCTFTMSSAGAAKVMAVQRTSVRRGTNQLVRLGVFVPMNTSSGGSRTKYVFADFTAEGWHATCQGGGTLRAQDLTRSVPEGWHATCAGVARSVRKTGTRRDPYSSVSLDSPKRILGEHGDLPAGGEPAVDPQFIPASHAFLGTEDGAALAENLKIKE